MNPPFTLSEYPDLYAFPNSLEAYKVFGAQFQFYKMGDNLAGPGSLYVKEIQDFERLRSEGITILTEPEENETMQIVHLLTPEVFDDNLNKALESISAVPGIRDHLNRVADLLYNNVADPVMYESFSRVIRSAYVLHSFDLKSILKLNLSTSSKHAWEIEGDNAPSFFYRYNRFLNNLVLNDSAAEYYCSVLKDPKAIPGSVTSLSNLVIANRQGFSMLNFSENLGYSLSFYSRKLTPGVEAIGDYVGRVIWNIDSSGTLYTVESNERPGDRNSKSRVANFFVESK